MDTLLDSRSEMEEEQIAKRAGVFAVLIDREVMKAEYGQDQTIHDLTELIALV
ncbi:MAG: hypothetical protein HFI75_09610 [Lachnospiraceae bacterium]|nr:hypothetical protein [Lachnospiraceae bacterium]